jgi:glycosyltransferase involved in cell wall biosynthesis
VILPSATLLDEGTVVQIFPQPGSDPLARWTSPPWRAMSVVAASVGAVVTEAGNAPPLRLLVVNYEFPPVGGGASFACLGLARTLANRGHEVHVLTSRLAGQPEIETIEGIQVHRVRSWRYGAHDCGLRGAATFILFAWLRMRKLLKTLSFDLVHYFFGLPCGVLSLYTFGKHQIPYIVSLRGSDVPLYDPLDLPLRISHWLLAPLTRRIWRRAGSVVPNSEALRRLAASFEPHVQFQVIPNAVDAISSRAPRKPPRREHVNVLCVARLIERKGLGVLLDAMASLATNNVRLHIVGSGRQQRELERTAKRKGLANRVFFHGPLPNGAVRELYRSADIFVLPTLSESCSMALLEAMSAGLPIVTTRAGGNPYLIEDGVNGRLVEPADVQGLRTAIEALAADPACCESMGLANVRRISERFSWVANADRYEAVYRRIVQPAKLVTSRSRA